MKPDTYTTMTMLPGAGTTPEALALVPKGVA